MINANILQNAHVGGKQGGRALWLQVVEGLFESQEQEAPWRLLGGSSEDEPRAGGGRGSALVAQGDKAVRRLSALRVLRGVPHEASTNISIREIGETGHLGGVLYVKSVLLALRPRSNFLRVRSRVTLRPPNTHMNCTATPACGRGS